MHSIDKLFVTAQANGKTYIPAIDPNLIPAKASDAIYHLVGKLIYCVFFLPKRRPNALPVDLQPASTKHFLNKTLMFISTGRQKSKRYMLPTYGQSFWGWYV